MNEEDKEFLMQGYLEGTLSTDDLRKAEELIKREPTVASELQGMRRVHKALHGLGIERFRKEMDMWDAELEDEHVPSPRVIPLYRYFAVAAIGLILIVSGIYIFMPSKQDPGALYAANFSPYEDLVSMRDVGGASLLERGMKAYNMQDYESGALLLGEYVSENLNDIRPYLYLGIAQMENNDIDAAVASFRKAGEDPLLRQQAQWYTALAYLKAGNTSEAVLILEEISTSADHYQQSRASDILDELQ